MGERSANMAWKVSGEWIDRWEVTYSANREQNEKTDDEIYSLHFCLLSCVDE